MSSIYLRHLVSTGVAGLVFSATASAGIPVWTFSAPNPAVVTVSSGGTATVQYTVTNQSAKPKNLKLKATPGLSASACQLATRGSICTLTLTINGSALPASGIHGGPVLCDQGNPNQCYQPSLPNGLNVSVSSVSTPPQMAAVGAYQLGSQTVPLSYYSLDGGNNWLVSSTLPQAQSTTQNLLFSVSCTTKGVCAAVGTYGRNSFAPANPLAPLTYYSTDNGKNWTVSSQLPLPPTAASQLTSVSCSESGLCAAVGYSEQGLSTKANLSYYSTDNGITWIPSATQPPTLSTNDQLTGVSCNDSGLLCAAVGYYEASLPTRNVPSSYYSTDGGTHWHTSTQMPQPLGTSGNQLSSVSCNANGSCAAVGNYDNGISRQLPLSYTSTDAGKTWIASTTMPPAKGSEDNMLRGVSCNANACAAVGSYQLNHIRQPLSYYSIDGGQTWTASPTMPLASSTNDAQLLGVVCKAQGICAAVGGVIEQAYASNAIPVGYYSIDNGKNWLTSSTLPPQGSNSALTSAG